MLRQAYNVSRENRADDVPVMRPNNAIKDLGIVRAWQKVGLTMPFNETNPIFVRPLIYSDRLAVPAERCIDPVD
jgi:hypothetical protein